MKKERTKALVEARKKQSHTATLADDAIQKGDSAKAIALVESELLHLADIRRLAETTEPEERKS